MNNARIVYSAIIENKATTFINPKGSIRIYFIPVRVNGIGTQLIAFTFSIPIFLKKDKSTYNSKQIEFLNLFRRNIAHLNNKAIQSSKIGRNFYNMIVSNDSPNYFNHTMVLHHIDNTRYRFDVTLTSLLEGYTLNMGELFRLLKYTPETKNLCLGKTYNNIRAIFHYYFYNVLGNNERIIYEHNELGYIKKGLYLDLMTKDIPIRIDLYRKNFSFKIGKKYTGLYEYRDINRITRELKIPYTSTMTINL